MSRANFQSDACFTPIVGKLGLVELRERDRSSSWDLCIALSDFPYLVSIPWSTKKCIVPSTIFSRSSIDFIHFFKCIIYFVDSFFLRRIKVAHPETHIYSICSYFIGNLIIYGVTTKTQPSMTISFTVSVIWQPIVRLLFFPPSKIMSLVKKCIFEKWKKFCFHFFVIMLDTSKS